MNEKMNEKMKEQVIAAVEVLKSGGIILYPTDTVWGIGCDATNASAIDKITKLKGREDKKSMIVITDSIDRAACYTNGAPEVAWELMEASDKPLTLILPDGAGVANNLLSEDGTIAIRVANHEFCRMLCRKLGRAVVSTSANITGLGSPRTFSDISKEVKEGVDLVVSPEFEGQPTGKPSSLIEFSRSSQITIIRE